MSVLRATLPEWSEAPAEAPVQRPRLRAVPRRPARLARMPFIGVLMAIFGVGMTGLLMLNTTLQNQTFQSRALTRQATELAHVQADLESRLDAAGTPKELARRASALGLRPNPHPAFLVVPSGKVIGKPTPVTGQEVPDLVVKTPAELAAHRARAAAKKKAAAEAKAAAQAKAAVEAKATAAAEAKAKAAAEAKAKAAAQ
ncbi:MAG: hypothetical protein ACLGIF_03215, partial [Actinomycetes bacterium]